MKGYMSLGLSVVLALVLLAVALLMPASQAAPVAADAVIGSSVVTMLDGDTVTATTYSAGFLSLNYAHAQVQAISGGAITTTGLVTVTPQFSNQPVSCGSVTSWFNAATTTVVTGPGSSGAEYTILGRCMRVKVESTASAFTPTVYTRFVNK